VVYPNAANGLPLAPLVAAIICALGLIGGNSGWLLVAAAARAARDAAGRRRRLVGLGVGPFSMSVLVGGMIVVAVAVAGLGDTGAANWERSPSSPTRRASSFSTVDSKFVKCVIDDAGALRRRLPTVVVPEWSTYFQISIAFPPDDEDVVNVGDTSTLLGCCCCR
jgi:hypothetical protein